MTGVDNSLEDAPLSSPLALVAAATIGSVALRCQKQRRYPDEMAVKETIRGARTGATALHGLAALLTTVACGKADQPNTETSSAGSPGVAGSGSSVGGVSQAGTTAETGGAVVIR